MSDIVDKLVNPAGSGPAVALCWEARNEITRLRDEVEKYKLAVDSFVGLIEASYGVAGLHLNGDIAEWSELLSGGRYEEWLSPIEAVLSEAK